MVELVQRSALRAMRTRCKNRDPTLGSTRSVDISLSKGGQRSSDRGYRSSKFDTECTITYEQCANLSALMMTCAVNLPQLKGKKKEKTPDS